MAQCDLCKRDMLQADGCLPTRLRFTPHGGGEPVDYDRIVWDGHGRCGDCNAAQRKPHHPGCDMERCPRCRGQLLSCSCNDRGTFADLIETLETE